MPERSAATATRSRARWTMAGRPTALSPPPGPRASNCKHCKHRWLHLLCRFTLYVPRDLLTRGKPHAWLRLHISDELVQFMHRSAVSGHLWVQGEHKHGALLIRAIKLFPV